MIDPRHAPGKWRLPIAKWLSRASKRPPDEARESPKIDTSDELSAYLCYGCRSVVWSDAGWQKFWKNPEKNEDLDFSVRRYKIAPDLLLRASKCCWWCKNIYEATMPPHFRKCKVWKMMADPSNDQKIGFFRIFIYNITPDEVQPIRAHRFSVSVSWWVDESVKFEESFDVSVYAKYGDPASEYFLSAEQSNPDANIQNAKALLHDCVQDHTACRIKQAPSLPTRVLDVYGEASSIRLRLGKDCEQSGFAFLSYRWGGPQNLMLGSTTEAHFMAGVQLKDLPPTLRDAVRVVRNLALRYIWIDALCIRQDSEADKKVEINNMQHYLRAALLVIQPSGVRSVQDYFLRPTPTPEEEMMETKLPVPTAHTDPAIIPYFDRQGRKSYLAMDPRPTYYDPVTEPLNSRGWVLQERLLCPRLLIFPSVGGVLWHCEEGEKRIGKILFVSEANIDHPRNKLQARDRLLTRNHLLTPKNPRDGGLSEPFTPHGSWWNIVRDYRNRELSHPMDKLTALAAIAEYYGQTFRHELGRYLAGHWSNFLIQTLLWDVRYPRDTRPPRRAPSWSWPAVDGIDGTFDPQIRSNFVIFILDCQIDVESELFPYGPVSDGRLTLRGPLQKASWEQCETKILDNPQRPQFDLTATENELPHCFAKKSRMPSCFPDSYDQAPKEVGHPEPIFILAVDTHRSTDGDGYGLLLKRNDDNTFRRVGHYKGYMKIADDHPKDTIVIV